MKTTICHKAMQRKKQHRRSQHYNRKPTRTPTDQKTATHYTVEQNIHVCGSWYDCRTTIIHPSVTLHEH